MCELHALCVILVHAKRFVSCWRLPAILNAGTNRETWHASAQVNRTYSTYRLGVSAKKIFRCSSQQDTLAFR